MRHEYEDYWIKVEFGTKFGILRFLVSMPVLVRNVQVVLETFPKSFRDIPAVLRLVD